MNKMPFSLNCTQNRVNLFTNTLYVIVTFLVKVSSGQHAPQLTSKMKHALLDGC